MAEDLQYEVLSNDYKNYHLSFKIIIIGDQGVGKSCLTLKGTKDVFNNNYQPTIGFEFCTFTIKIKTKKETKIIKCQIWDTCGQEAYRSLVSSFYKNSSLAFIVYAINDKKSFNNIEIWLNEIKTYNPDIKIFLIGSKVDLDNERQVSKDEAQEIVKEHKFQFFLETSAKTGFNTQNVFIECAKSLYLEYLNYNTLKGEENVNGFIVNRPHINDDINYKNENHRKKKCCESF